MSKQKMSVDQLSACRKQLEQLQIPQNAAKALIILLIFVAGCSGNPLEDTSDFPSGIEAKEAPMWAKLVAEDKLPSLAERLPENPLVAKTNFDGYERPGPYGGTWHRSIHIRIWEHGR